MQSTILKNLHPLLRIAWEASGRNVKPASEEDISQLLAAHPDTPEDYLNIIREYEYLFFDTQPKNDYFSLYLHSPQDVLAWKTWYPWLDSNLPGTFFFGMDGDISFFLGEHAGRYGVYRVETSAGDWEAAVYLAPSIRALLCDGTGWAQGEQL